MSIGAIGSVMTQALRPVSGASPGGAPPPLKPTDVRRRDSVSLSEPAKLLSHLRALQESDPEEFKRVMGTITPANSGNAITGTEPRAQQLFQEMAAKLASARSGPPPPPPPPSDVQAHPEAFRRDPGPRPIPDTATVVRRNDDVTSVTDKPITSTEVYDAADSNQDGKVTSREREVSEQKQSEGTRTQASPQSLSQGAALPALANFAIQAYQRQSSALSGFAAVVRQTLASVSIRA